MEIHTSSMAIGAPQSNEGSSSSNDSFVSRSDTADVVRFPLPLPSSYRDKSIGESHSHGHSHSQRNTPSHAASKIIPSIKALGVSSLRYTLRSLSKSSQGSNPENDNDNDDEVEYDYTINSKVAESTKVSVSEIEFLAQKKGGNPEDERFHVKPAYAYPKTRFNRDELRREMNRQSSYYHDLRPTASSGDGGIVTGRKTVGAAHVEILQCFGIPRPDFRKESSAFCILVCGSYAFKTDVMPPVANPMWLSKMRRACIFPLFEAYSRICIGVFARAEGNARDYFIGRIVVDVSHLRPGSTYDVTLPLRQSNLVYARQKRGSLRFRIHLTWEDERAAMLSYLPKGGFTTMPRFRPHDELTVRCCDNKSFQNVTRVVHGHDSPGKFSMKLVQATMREFNFIRINLLRYLRKREIRDMREWRYPLISMFIFVSWMHSVYVGSMKYVPGNVLTYVLLQLWKNYALYVIDGKFDKGFVGPTWEEMMAALAFGKPHKSYIQPVEMKRKDPQTVRTALSHCGDADAGGNPVRAPTLEEMAREFKEGVTRTGRTGRKGRRRDATGSTFFGGDINTFLGSDGVDFFVERKFADTRWDAVLLGIKMQEELRLFEHVRRRIEFRDADLYYSFSNFDTNEYAFKTHRPWFRTLSHIVGFYNDINDEEAHLEFPFASGLDHPRFNIKDSIVIRSKEVKKTASIIASTSTNVQPAIEEVLSEDDDEEFQMEDATEKGNGTYSRATSDMMRHNLDPLKRLNMTDSPSVFSVTSPAASQDFDYDTESVNLDMNESWEEMQAVDIKVLAKPPNQDMNFQKKADKTIAEALTDTKNEIHRVFGHLFHDRSYKLRVETWTDQKTALTSTSSHGTNSRMKRVTHSRSNSNVSASSVSSKRHRSATTKKDDLAVLKMRKDEYDKLLQSGKYSSNNVIVSKVAVIVQPLVEIIQLGLGIFRALYNLFMWRDPVLTFWLQLFLMIAIPMMHIVPWRIVLGTSGLIFVGPQNWVLRVIRESKSGPTVPDFDLIVKKKEKKPDELEVDNIDAPLFSSYAPDNRPVRDSQLDKSDIKEVAVPHSQLMYRRCYDWPPEPEYARVWKGLAPRNDSEAEKLLESDGFEMYDGTFDDKGSVYDSKSRNSHGWKKMFGLHLPKHLKRHKKKAV
jgi:hypothetical protein